MRRCLGARRSLFQQTRQADPRSTGREGQSVRLCWTSWSFSSVNEGSPGPSLEMKQEAGQPGPEQRMLISECPPRKNKEASPFTTWGGRSAKAWHVHAPCQPTVSWRRQAEGRRLAGGDVGFPDQARHFPFRPPMLTTSRTSLRMPVVLSTFRRRRSTCPLVLFYWFRAQDNCFHGRAAAW